MEETKCIQKGSMRQGVIDFLVYIPLFDQLEADELEIAERYMNLIEINKDEVLFKEGEKGNYVCFIVDGTLDVVKQSATGESITITELSRGQVYSFRIHILHRHLP